MFDWFYKFLGMILSFFNGLTGNYLVAVIIFALLFKIVLFPFSIKQQKNSIKQASLRPKEMAIRKKYKGREDQESKNKMNMEVQEMYQAEGYSPFSGCLPMLLQLPIILALYEVIRKPLTYICGLDIEKCNEALKKVGAITENLVDELHMVDLLKNNPAAAEHYAELAEASLPNFSVFGINLAPIPLEEIKSGGMGLLYLLIPVLTFVFMYGSMKLTRRFSYQPEQDPSAGCSMKVMDLMMPLMSTYFAAVWPSIMGVYWMFNNVLSVVQQLALHKMFPLPVLIEEDYKNAERQIRGKAPKYATPASDPRVVEGKKYRSLHHIDDEDDTPAPELPPMKIDQDDDQTPPPADAPILKEDKPDRKKKK